MKILRVDLYDGYAGEGYANHNKLIQYSDETTEDFIERVTNVLFEDVEQLVEGDDSED